MTEFAEARKVAALLAAVAEPTRLRVLWQLAKGPQHVGKLADLVDIKMVNMSHHLGVMRQAGVLEDEKDGRQVIYRLRPDVFIPGTTPDVLGVLTLGSFRVVMRAKPEAPPVSINTKTRRKTAKK
ncbi:Biofilm growth-associated repressor [Gemmata sp. SH-PL17]|uniref:HTH arsR-type domain-containing protein n=1 Tax=Gemmata massiliana TaxID=1210884 RepID=A0A6P2DCW5_9BACT|nr:MULTISPECIES: metalloregulator ArsR/SmtB family transcription factor [Gemmata]AMV23897.1 Biofilm growth-associated repressor [Gemmata sp. SH-PL17]VTR99449.1 family transcriptional regulator : Transcriptional regulator, ArsR family OS=Pirellula staleyi (strain ATCC 27377 / DSM 6068 / ICPB 4128) GN=Psta_1414 PE=4 SV=1: HTH_20 [Gemmata massiliana]